MTDKPKILLCLAHMSGNEMKYIEEAFKDNWVVPLGPNVDAFEDDLRRFVADHPSAKDKQVVALASGTSAVHLALLAAGVRPGDEVICQSMTFCASCNPIVYIGATPIFVDSEENSWNIDPQLLERAILERKRATGKYPAAIIPVYLYGMPADIDSIMEVAERYGIPVIEDAAEGFGSRYRGRVAGTFGRFGVMSFNGNKMITTSGGGALICPDPETRRKVMFYATQARENFPFYQHEEIGYNYRMSNICAGIGRGQMTVANDHIAHHRHLADIYREAFADIDGIEFHDNPSPDYDSNFWLNTITISPSLRVRGQEEVEAEGPAPVEAPNANVEALRRLLAQENIETRPLWKPMHRQPVFSGATAFINGVSDRLFQTGLCLPSGPWVSDDDARRIVALIADAIGR